MEITKKERRMLRKKLGSRTSRRSGVKSVSSRRGTVKPSTRLKLAIREYVANQGG